MQRCHGCPLVLVQTLEYFGQSYLNPLKPYLVEGQDFEKLRLLVEADEEELRVPVEPGKDHESCDVNVKNLTFYISYCISITWDEVFGHITQ